MHTIWKLLVLSLSGCVAPAIVEEYDRSVEDMRVLVEQHAADAESAQSLEAVEALEAPYHDDWANLSTRMGQDLGAIADCTMPSKGAPAMDPEDAIVEMQTIDHMMSTHMTDHEDHVDVSECWEEEAVHRDTMLGMLDDLEEFGASWSRHGMNCPSL